MKLLILIFFSFSIVTQGVKAQDQGKKNVYGKIKILKIAFINENLNMPKDVAKDFWTIYNRYEDKRMELHKRENLSLNKSIPFSENIAEEMLRGFLAIEKEEYLNKKKLYSDLKKKLSAKDIIKLHKLEYEFRKKLLREY